MTPFMRSTAHALAFLPLTLTAVSAQFGTYVDPSVLDACPGYAAQNVEVDVECFGELASVDGSPLFEMKVA